MKKRRRIKRLQRARAADRRQTPERVIEAVLAEPWAIQPEWMATILAIASRQQSDLEAVARKHGTQMDGTERVHVRDGIATIAVHGPIFRYANLFTAVSGATSVATLATDLQSALDSDEVTAILLDIDSPGGQVNGIAEVARMIFDARDQKSIVAYVGGTAASAAYWIASAASEIVASETAMLGSIGVMGTFVEQDVEGERSITIVSNQSPAKNPDPFSKDGRARIQRNVDALAQVFIDAVARYRGVSQQVVLRDYGQGDVLVGAEAVQAGLADALGSFEGTMEALMPDQSQQPEPFVMPIRHVAARPWRDVAAAMIAPEPMAIGMRIASADIVPIDEIVDDTEDDDDEQLSPADVIPDPAVSPATEADTQEDEHMKKDQDSSAAAVVDHGDAVRQERERCAAITRWGEHFACSDVAMQCIDDELSVEASLERMRQIVEERRNARPAIAPADTDQPAVTSTHDRALDEPWGPDPETALGNQLVAVANHAIGRGRPDPRLFHVPDDYRAATGINEAVDSEGGFLVAPDQSSRFLENMWETGEVMSRVTRTTVGGNGLKVPGVDERSRANGSRWGGVTGYWVDEGVPPTLSKQDVRMIELTLKKVAAAVTTTDEELEDAPALGQRLARVVPDELTFKTEDAIINGDGVGKPLGALTSAATVSVAIESGQTIANTNTHIVTNVAKMISRLPGRSLQNAVLLFNNQMFYQFVTATVGGSGAPPVFLPGGTADGAPFGTFLGIPMVPVEYCAAQGTPGDILLIDLTQYEVIDKGGVRNAQSIHVKFLEEETTFRFSMRVDGQPSWGSSITPFKGSGNISPIITLAARA